MVFEFVDKPIRHTVIVDMGDDHSMIVYEGPDYDRAAESCNFWDERSNSWLVTEVLPLDALSVAMRKFDALEAYIAEKADKIGVLPKEVTSGFLAHANQWH